jgi:hypothetical protein
MTVVSGTAEREREEEIKSWLQRGEGEWRWQTGLGRLIFLLSLDPNLPPSRAWRSNIFIGDRRGTLCLFWCKISALGSTRNHPNHWLKVAMINCQFSAGKIAGRVGHFGAVPRPLQHRSTRTVYTSLYSMCQGIVFVQVPFNLGKKRGIKRLGKEAPQVASLKKKMNSNFLPITL